ncbi:MAG: TetR/AcrR family transcriptional regulator [Chloroflexota bacterium]|nr:TetR/AcrR family transcriptional regulator [Chloroflexota bacterium]
MAETPGLRERKKRRTRDTIVRAAVELFAERGYHDTTVAAIAERAEVAVSTVFAYFPTKEDLVFHAYPALQAGFAQRLGHRRPGESALDAFRDWLARELPALLAPETAEGRTLRAVIDGDERLLAQERYRLGYFEEVAAMAIAADLDDAPDGLRPRIIAGAALGAMTALLTHGRGATPRDPQAQAEVIVAFLAAGMAAIGASAPPADEDDPPAAPARPA